MKDFNRFLITVCAVFVLIFVVDRFGGVLGDKYAVFIDQPKYKRINMADEEIVILGASRAEDQYVPQILEDSLGGTVYNYGVGAQNVYTNYCILNLLIKDSKRKPQIVIWDFYFTDIMDTPGWNTEKLYRLYSAYNYDDTIKSVLKLQGLRKELFLDNISLYKLNSKLTRAIVSNPRDLRVERNKGYNGLNITLKDTLAVNDEDRTQLDSIKLSYISRMFSLCKDNDIKLFVFISPAYYLLPPQSDHDWDVVISTMCEMNNIPFYNFEQDSTFLNNRSYFYNQMHLNDKGARAYSSLVASKVKAILKQED